MKGMMKDIEEIKYIVRKSENLSPEISILKKYKNMKNIKKVEKKKSY